MQKNNEGPNHFPKEIRPNFLFDPIPTLNRETCRLILYSNNNITKITINKINDKSAALL